MFHCGYVLVVIVIVCSKASHMCDYSGKGKHNCLLHQCALHGTSNPLTCFLSKMCYVRIQIFHCQYAFKFNEEQNNSKQLGFIWWLWTNSWFALLFAHVKGGAYFDQICITSRCSHCWICGFCQTCRSQIIQIVHESILMFWRFDSWCFQVFYQPLKWIVCL